MFRSQLILALTFMVSLCIAQTAVSTEMPKATSIDATTAIDLYIQKYVDEGKVPGGVFQVVKDGKELYNNTFGENAPGDPYAEDDIWRIASMTKAITCTAIMQLVEQGKLNLDDPLSKHFPAFGKTGVLDTFNPIDSSFTTVPVTNPLTIRHLMSHTSGIYYPLFSPGKLQAIGTKIGSGGYGIAGVNTTEEMVNHLAMQPLAHQPGTQWTYGLNMEVLGGVVAKVSGKQLQSYFKDHIFSKLGIKDTWFYQPEYNHGRVVNLYAPMAPGKNVVNPDPNMAYPMMADHDHYAGGGGMSGTAGDYMTFIQMLLNGGSHNGSQILKPESVALLATDQLAPMGIDMSERGWLGMTKNDFGLGFSVTREESAGPYSPGTYAWGGYFNTKFWIDPVEKMTFVGMTNIVPFQYNEFWDGLYELIYKAVEQ